MSVLRGADGRAGSGSRLGAWARVLRRAAGLAALGAFGLGGGAAAAELAPPLGLRWGASAQDVFAALAKTAKLVGTAEGRDPDRFLEEQRYEGDALGQHSDQIGPLFYAGQLFALAVSYPPSPTRPASMIWDQLVAKLTASYGRAVTHTKPLELLSLNAILRLLPPEANKGKLMELYNAADKDRVLGRYMLLDLQIQTGSWVPEAVWTFTNGATVKAVMRAGSANDYGLRNLKPAVLFTHYEQLK